MSEQATTDADFNAWCDQVDAYGRERGCDFDYTHHTGRECWRDAFEDGVTPRDALDEEFSCAAADVE